MTSPAGPRAVVDSVAAALRSAPAYRQLPPETRRSLMASLGQIGGYLATDAAAAAPWAGGPNGATNPWAAGQAGAADRWATGQAGPADRWAGGHALAAEPSARGLAEPSARGLADPLGPGGLPRPGGTQPAPGGTPPGGAPAGAPAGGGGTPAGGGGTVGRVGELARATLNAVDFPSFVSGLIKGTFQAIVDATIQQMEAYATLLQEVAKTVDDYMRDNVTEDSARDYLADRYPSVLTRNTTTGTPSLDVDLSNPTQQLPTFFTDLGFDMPAEIDPDSVEQVIVPAARKTMAEQRHQTLATMVLLGLNRIIISDGEINAKLQFHVDASETTGIKFDSTQTSMGNMAGTSGKSTFSGNGIMVNTVSLNAQSDINLRTDLTGEVRVKFVSDVLPLASFANSAAIQLINQNATVPSSTPLPPVADGTTPTPAAGAAPVSPVPAVGPTASPAQSLPTAATEAYDEPNGAATYGEPATAAYDPWRPRR
ncbi:hypothetical protein ACQPZX_28080 [Actinoplanes sp. CA-142083]|uniref:hypothetical protein n=1 Tax=Actinoplanes sp. CA-142083 TaxID=3239903 RepID=UPI003D9416D5